MEKIWGVVILYHPETAVVENIASYSGQVAKLIVFDNSEPASGIDLTVLGEKIVLIADGENRGIAERLNAAARMAIEDGAAWLLTMDQDSSFYNGQLTRYLSCFENFKDRDNVAMFGVTHAEKEQNTTGCVATATDNLITSGSLVNLNIFRRINGFDENLFIDEVDFEYCARSNANGFKTLQFTQVHLNHTLGEIAEHRSLKTLHKTSRVLHSPLRLYYMVRNFLYVRKKHATLQTPSFRVKQKDLLHRIKNNFLYGNDRARLISFILKGYRHYKKGITGKWRPNN